jgi:hypothetical protein
MLNIFFLNFWNAILKNAKTIYNICNKNNDQEKKLYELLIGDHSLKGQSDEKVGEIRTCENSLGPNYKSSYWYLNFSDRPFSSCEFSKF